MKKVLQAISIKFHLDQQDLFPPPKLGGYMSSIDFTDCGQCKSVFGLNSLIQKSSFMFLYIYVNVSPALPPTCL